jgi:hypothetical protein
MFIILKTNLFSNIHALFSSFPKFFRRVSGVLLPPKYFQDLLFQLNSKFEICKKVGVGVAWTIPVQKDSSQTGIR